MADYFSELGFRPLGEGEVPDHGAHLLRLLRDSGNYDLLEMFVRLRNDDGGNSAPAASEKVVQELPLVQPLPKEQCSVCLKNYDEDDPCRMMPCKHKFHQNCIFTWLKQTNSCPICRKELPTDDPDYEAIKKHKEREDERKQQLESLHNSMFS
ncbi:E3 ubiquitin-protein ligase RNF181-like [Neocloeon triangulifer]|uniref:E3 ubiquitin-protein ligase RNF181-like n=1 Tax=Neocloeon triangulifer TaxID=2078957 RepID=UPI00286EFE97|nr:E3 ubiquitin-protein ligase RNF181-like [Neocloeon triangulifer]